ncbi:hypothetical protein H257_03990 [Aphanomyces astaci]|uniref:Uncharacterized protein n=1 Tax=Aphanomyces astaci TaxID=112090 RepID=W4GWC2_APHAT|nr:hypothetical protein H257_03990 [Aphanomyces astaci]ETV83203.1 hypothetical protein H257_03990 [Aphanomyces astaci]|eukprot:XP_009826633.1 hypothetical protein H257_03990 [Aphanomyces astaci]
MMWTITVNTNKRHDIFQQQHGWIGLTPREPRRRCTRGWFTVNNFLRVFVGGVSQVHHVAMIECSAIGLNTHIAENYLGRSCGVVAGLETLAGFSASAALKVATRSF